MKQEAVFLSAAIASTPRELACDAIQARDSTPNVLRVAAYGWA